MSREIILQLILCLATSLQVTGQDSLNILISQPFRLEIEQAFSDNDFTVISLKRNGLVLLQEKNENKAGNRIWELNHLDSVLKENQKIEIDVDPNKFFFEHIYSEGHLTLLFKTEENIATELDMYSIQLSNYEVKKFRINPGLSINFTHFINIGKNYALGGYIGNEPVILYYNFDSDNLIVLPGVFQKNSKLLDLRANQNNTFNVVLADQTSGITQIILKTFDINGIELYSYKHAVNENYTIHSGLSSTLIHKDFYIVGLLGNRNDKQSKGFFLIPINPFKEKKFKSFYFGELHHYLDYQNSNRANRTKQKTLNSRKASKVPNFTNHVKPHRLVEYNEGVILLAEIYSESQSPPEYPDDYTGYRNPLYGFNDNYYNRYNNYYDRYRYLIRYAPKSKISHAVLIAFSFEGERSWDVSVNMSDLSILGKEQTSDFCLSEGNPYMVYKKDSELKIKSVNLEYDREVQSTVPIKLTYPNQVIRSEQKYYGGIRFWYGKSFYVWGKQTIRDNSKRNEGTRQVFYVNKVVVH